MSLKRKFKAKLTYNKYNNKTTILRSEDYENKIRKMYEWFNAK